MRAPSRSVTAALVPAGAIGGHVLGYLIAREDAALHGTHSHLRPAAWVAAALAAAAVTSFALCRPSREQGAGRLRIVFLLAGQVGLFSLVEAVEQLQAGHGTASSFVTDPSFRWGVLAQLLSAALLVAVAGLARASGERVRALLARPGGFRPTPSRVTWRGLRTVVVGSVRSSAVSERGPPRLLASA